MKAFFAVIMEMGCPKRPKIISYWSTNSRNILWFRKMFSKNRFLTLLIFFHLVNNEESYPPGHQQYDPCDKFQPLVDHANNVFRQYYVPHQYISVDESLVGTKTISHYFNIYLIKNIISWV